MTADEIDDLIFRYLGGTLDEAGHRQLEQLLASDAQCSRRFAELSLQETLLCAMGEADSAVEREPANQLNKRLQRTASTNLRKTQNLFSRIRFWGSLAAAIALVVGLAYFYNAADSGKTTLTATIIEIRGAASIQLGNTSVSARYGARVTPGETVKTAADSNVRLQYPDKTEIALLPGSELTLVDLPANQQKRLQLATGALQATVAKQPVNQPLLIDTPQAEVKVVGTVFKVRANQTQTRLEVKEGTVRMTRLADHNEVSVTGGQSATATPNGGVLLTNVNIPDGTYVIKAVISGLALADENTHAVQQTYTKDNMQHWAVSNVGDSLVKIVCVGSGRALENPNSNTTAGTNLGTADYSGGSNQHWKIVSPGDGRYEIINASSDLQANVAYSATEPGRAICQWVIGDYPNGVWTFTPVNETQTSPSK